MAVGMIWDGSAKTVAFSLLTASDQKPLAAC